MDKIRFWKTQEENGELSNFYPSKMIIDKKEYATVEHYYQSKKFKGTEFEELVRIQPTARKAKDMARSKESKNFRRDDWYEMREIVMAVGLFYKFKQERFKNFLLSTGDKEICEDSPYDYYWGVGADDTGENMLGKMLMKLREHIRNEESKKNKFIS